MGLLEAGCTELNPQQLKPTCSNCRGGLLSNKVSGLGYCEGSKVCASRQPVHPTRSRKHGALSQVIIRLQAQLLRRVHVLVPRVPYIPGAALYHGVGFFDHLGCVLPSTPLAWHGKCWFLAFSRFSLSKHGSQGFRVWGQGRMLWLHVGSSKLGSHFGTSKH